MILCSTEPRIISCLPTRVINDNSLEILYVSDECLWITQNGIIYLSQLQIYEEDKWMFNDTPAQKQIGYWDIKQMVIT